MRVASIDIGTNTVLLLIAEIDDHGTIIPIEHQQRFPRLGKEVDKKFLLTQSAFITVTDVLNEYRSISKKYQVDSIIACATSAVRDSSNKYEFLTHLKNVTGIIVEVISGEDEALLTYKGAISGLSTQSERTVVLDIGGGSTEISFKRNNEFISHSLQIGAVRLTEHYFKHNPPTDGEIEMVNMVITNEYLRLGAVDLSEYILVGVAGTITTLACLDQNLNEFDIKKVSGYKLTYECVEEWSNKLIKMTSSKIQSLSNTTEGRADILPAGVLILRNFMEQFEFKEIFTCERGLRYGLALREWEKKLRANSE